MDAQPTLITIAQAAHMLGVSPDTVRRMVARGQLPVVRLTPRIVRIPRAAVEALGEER